MPPQKQCCCATTELSIEIYRDAYYADLHNRRGYAYYILYINIYSLWFTLGFMGIKEI